MIRTIIFIFIKTGLILFFIGVPQLVKGMEKRENPDFIFYSAINMRDIFSNTNYQMDQGIKGAADNSGSITIKVFSDIISEDNVFENILLYEYKSDTSLNTDTYTGVPINYSGNVPYNLPWKSDDLMTSTLYTKQEYVKKVWKGDGGFVDLMGSVIPVKIEVIIDNAYFLGANIPGVGEFTVNNANNELIYDITNVFRNGNYNSNIKSLWDHTKLLPENPNPFTEDLIYAAHRGFWGNDLGAGPVENTQDAIEAALPYTKIIESDISVTKDGVLVVSHDYTLNRLTNYNGTNPDNTFIFNLNFNQIKDLKLRKRNFDVSHHNFIALNDLISYMVKYETVLTIDIKEKWKRINPNTGDCTFGCDLSNIDRQKGWVEIFAKVLDLVQEKDAWQYVAVKTPFTINQIKQYMPTSKYKLMERMLYFPVIQPQKKSSAALDFVNDWYNNGRNYYIGFETNFKTESSNLLQPINYNGKQYSSLLEYVVSKLNARPGLYPEEPMGPKGIVDRYGQWIFKNLTEDYRGDQLWLINIPYYFMSIITTDRPDIWQELVRLYNQ